MPNIYVCTELVVDQFGDSPSAPANRYVLGGAGRFAASAAASLLSSTRSSPDQKVYFLSPMSTDSYGDEFRGIFDLEGVNYSLASSIPNPSMIARVFPKSDGSGNDYFFPIPEPADLFVSNASLPSLGSDTSAAINPKGSVFIFGSVSAVLEPAGRAWLEYATQIKNLGGIVIYDLNARDKALPTLGDGKPDWRYYREIVDAWSKVADIIKASDEDLERAYPDYSIIDRMMEWIKTAKCAVVTRGKAGSVAISTNELLVEQESIQLNNVANTVGAGDNFLAGLAVHILNTEHTNPGGYLSELQFLLQAGTNAANLHLLKQNPKAVVADLPSMQLTREERPPSRLTP